MNMRPILMGLTACSISSSPESEQSRVGTERWCVTSRLGVDPIDDGVRQLSMRTGFRADFVRFASNVVLISHPIYYLDTLLHPGNPLSRIAEVILV